MNQQMLFDQEPLPPHSGPQTSQAAAEQLENPAALRRKVLDYIAAQGSNGATDEEIQRALHMSGDTQRPRRWELAKAGRIKRHTAGLVRQTRTGRDAQVWVAAGGTG